MPDSLQLSDSIGKRVDPTYSKVLHTRLTELLHSQNDSFPGSQPVSFESRHLVDIEREDYFVCEKSDGVRYLLFCLHSPKGPASFLFDRNKHWYYVPNLLFPVRGRENEYLKDTLMDGELVLDIDVHKKTWRYLIFDLMVVNGSTIVQRSFNSRLGVLQQDVIQPFNARMKNQTDTTKLPPFTVELKKMERAYGLHLVFDQIPKLKHKSDGIIWTPVKYPYTSGTCEKLLKWKPPELNTVDFRIAARWSKEHKPIYSIEVLSNGVTYKFYDHFQPEPALATEWKNQLPDGRIAEFRYDPQCEVTIIEQGYAPTVRKGGWRFVRFRDDKSTANDEMVVKKILNSIQDGVTKEQLLLCMDRVRAAWKAREKGLPMPPLHQPKNLSLSTQLLSSPSTSMNTPTFASPVVNSPSTSVFSSAGYFREKEDNSRQNSISEESPLTSTAKRKSSTSEDSMTNRKSSVSSQSTPLREELESEKKEIEEEHQTVERKRLKAVVEEDIPKEQEQPSPVRQPTEQKTQQNEHIPRRRKKSSFDESQPLKKLPLEESNPQTPPLKSSSSSPQVRKSTTRTTSAPTVVLKQKESSPQPRQSQFSNQSSPSSSPANRVNRRSKSIPQLSNEAAPTTTKKLKSSTSSIQNLLTTSVEPTSSSNSSSSNNSNNNRAYDFSNILQQQRKQTEQPAMIQAQVQQQQQPVQFINFHAEGRQSPNNHPNMNNNVHHANNNNHVLIIRSESNSQPSSPLHPAHVAPPSSHHHPQQQQQQRIWKNNIKYEGHPQQQVTEQSYSPYNVVPSVPPYHHSPQKQPFQPPPPPAPAPAPPAPPAPAPPLSSSYYGQPYPQQAPPPTQLYSGSYHPHRRHEQQVAHPYPPQQQQQHLQQPQQQQQSVQPSSKRKNSQKAKLDFILN